MKGRKKIETKKEEWKATEGKYEKWKKSKKLASNKQKIYFVFLNIHNY